MGKRGIKPEPTSIKRLKGNPGRRPLPENEPQPVGFATMPDWLSDKGKETWCEVAPLLEAMGLLNTKDTGFLCMYCEAWSDYFRACELVKEHGEICESEKGGFYQHPAVGYKNKMREHVLKIGAEFGMSPSSMVGLEVKAVKEVDPLDVFKDSLKVVG